VADIDCDKKAPIHGPLSLDVEKEFPYSSKSHQSSEQGMPSILEEIKAVVESGQ